MFRFCRQRLFAQASVFEVQLDEYVIHNADTCTQISVLYMHPLYSARCHHAQILCNIRPCILCDVRRLKRIVKAYSFYINLQCSLFKALKIYFVAVSIKSLSAAAIRFDSGLFNAYFSSLANLY